MWDKRYAESGYAYGCEPNLFLAENAGHIPDGPILDLAAGEGRNTVYLAELGHAVEAVDASSVGLAKARELARARGVVIETTVADLAAYDVGAERWAGIVAVFCHLPPALRARVHRAAVAGLRPGGVLVLEAYTKAQLGRGTGGPPVPELLYDRDEVLTELSGLNFERAEVVEREVVEGRYHRGIGSVLQILAVKP